MCCKDTNKINCQTQDLKHYKRLTEDGPILVSPHASGALRYMDVVDMGDELFYYYEYTCADGSHELRLSKKEK